jgi:hypothetical protein
MEVVRITEADVDAELGIVKSMADVQASLLGVVTKVYPGLGDLRLLDA